MGYKDINISSMFEVITKICDFPEKKGKSHIQKCYKKINKAINKNKMINISKIL